jgi:FAS-associated factor 2
MEAFTIDDSEQGPLLGNAGSSRTTPPAPLISRRSIFALITFPFNLLSNILRFLFGVLHIPLPRTFFSFNVFSPHRPGSTNRHFTDDPKSVVDRWIRSLEDETGAICLGRIDRSESTGVAGPSTSTASSALRSRADSYENPRILPEFYLGGYEQAMRACQKELKIGCIILVSEEHENVAEFKRSSSLFLYIS